MPIPALNAQGYLPPGIHDTTLDEIRAAFTGNIQRSNCFEGLLRFVEMVAAHKVVRYVFVDGSFTTAKVDPGDVDVVIELPPPAAYAPFKLVFDDFLNVQKTKKLFHVHPFTVVFGASNGWVKFFQGLKTHDAASKKLPPNYRKGILRINLK